MSQLLFLVGLGLIFVGRLNIGDLDVEGRAVRAAGALLTLPLIAVLILGQVLHWLNGSTVGGEGGGKLFLVIIELTAMIICSGAAYIMLKRASQEDNESETLHTTSTLKLQPKDKKPTAPTQQPRNTLTGRSKPSGSGYSDLMRPRAQSSGTTRKRDDFPAVMDIRDAARYLNKTEKEVMKLIDQGKLAAAKINYRFRISRTVLDDFIEEQKNSSDPTSG